MTAAHQRPPERAEPTPRTLEELPTPALVVDAAVLEANLATMAAALPGPRLRPHVKAHKCTALARRQREAGHAGFTAATVKEVECLAAAGLGDDVLLANEVLDPARLARLGALVRDGRARVTLAVDSEATLEAAARGGVREVLIDVEVGLPRCGCDPADAGRLAELARGRGLSVRGVMGYEGHTVIEPDRARRAEAVEAAMALLLRAAADVGGEVVSAGATVTYDLNAWASEIQAGSYALMDTTFATFGLPFRPALSVLATVVSTSRKGWAVADCGLKALGMDHGNPTVEGAKVWFCSDEHVTFSSPDQPSPAPGDRVRVWPAHVDPTVAYHERLHVADGDSVVDVWPLDMRGW